MINFELKFYHLGDSERLSGRYDFVGYITPGYGETARLTVRADLYNLLNHANLNNPASYYGLPSFGVATYGRVETNSSFPLLEPLSETARQIQILLRLEF